MKFVINCPPMYVYPTIRPWVRKTQELYCPDCSLELPDGNVQPFWVTFPPCFVRMQSIGEWLVDAVTATGTLQYSERILTPSQMTAALLSGWGERVFDVPLSRVSITLDKERVVRSNLSTMTALAVDSKGEVVWPSGQRGILKATFPEVASHAVSPVLKWFGAGKYLVDAVTAVGEWEMVGAS